MTVRQVVVDVLLVLAVAIVLISSVGVLMMRDAYQRLHYVTPISLVAPIFVGLAVLVKSGHTMTTIEMWLALLFVVIASPLVSHATIRATRIRETGDWRPDGGRENRSAKARK